MIFARREFGPTTSASPCISGDTTSAATVPLFFLSGFALIRSPIGAILSAV
jgi:hypothetical protein